MSFNRFFVFFALLCGAALLQHSTLTIFQIKPLWVLFLLIPIVILHEDFFANVSLVLLGALLLKSEYFFEIEIFYMISFFLLVSLVRRYVFKQEILLLCGSIIFLSAGLALISSYPFWYEILYSALLAGGVFVIIKKTRHGIY